MGTIAELFESGKQSNNKSHFRNLVMLARVDGKVTDDEMVLLKRIASRLSLTDQQVETVIQDKEAYPMVPPHNKWDRYERFINLVRVVFADGEVQESESKLVRRYALALGFTTEQFEEKYPEILSLLKEGMSKDDILEKIVK